MRLITLFRIPSSPVLSAHVAVDDLEKLFLDVLVGEVIDMSLCDDDDIDLPNEAVRVFPEYLADPPLDPIALNRISNLTRYGDSKS